MKALSLLFGLAVALLLHSCTKEKVIEPFGYADKIELSPVSISDDSIILTWTALNNHEFDHYEIIKKTSPETRGHIIAYITDKKIISMSDKDVSYRTFVAYQVVGYLKTNAVIQSNIVTYTQPEIPLSLQLKVINEDSVELTWSKISHKSLRKFIIYRTLWEGSSGQPLAEFTDLSKNNFIDSSFIYRPYIGYYVKAEFSNGNRVVSDVRSFNPPVPSIKLDPLVITRDSILLTWKSSKKNAFQIYYILRTTPAGSVQLGYTSGPPVTFYTDTQVPYTKDITYRIIGSLDGTWGDGQLIGSNNQTYSRPEIVKLNFDYLKDIIYDADLNLIYFFEKNFGKTVSFNTNTNRVQNSIKNAVTIGYSCIGTFNGNKELYIARNDGWINIYNASTLEQIDQINIGYEIAAVAYHNDKLFVTTGNGAALKIFDRLTKKELIKGEGTVDAKLITLPNTNSEFIAVNSGLSKYTFNPVTQSLTKDSPYGLVNTSQWNTTVFPSGNKIISGFRGDVFDKDLNKSGQLLHGDAAPFSSYAVDEAKSEIYAASKYIKKIYVYSSVSYLLLRTINTHLVPLAIFIDDNRIISVSSDYTIEYHTI